MGTVLEISFGPGLSDSPEGADSRVEFSSGSMPAASERYCAGAIVPRGPWHQKLPDILREAQANEGDPVGVGLVRFPPQILDDFHKLVEAGHECSMSRLEQVVQSPDAQIVLHRFRRFMDAALECGGAFLGPQSTASFCLKGADSETVTLNPADGCLTGLHVDDWSALPLTGRDQAAHRVVGNFGWEDRFLLFLGVPLHTLAQGAVSSFSSWYQDCGRTEVRSGCRASTLARSFLRSHPSFPISRLRVKPGEAYIAPTENLVHDGSSAGTVTVDVSCHVWVR